MAITAAAYDTAHLLNGYGLVAGARADLMPFGPERTAISAAAARAYSFAHAIERGVGFTADRFAQIAREIDADMADAGDRQLPAQADRWIAAYTG